MATPQTILNLLQNFRGIEPLKELFWVELNYDRDNRVINDLPEKTSDLVAEPPLCLAIGGRDNNFHIIYVQLKTEKLRKTDERQIITHLQTRYPDALYIFSNLAQEQWHFINVKLAREKQEQNGQQREQSLKQRNLFRRITIGPDERLRTASERIAMLDLEGMDGETGLFDNQELLTALEIRKTHEEAFNVEAVTKAFFESYKAIFKKLQDNLETQTNAPKWAHDYAQQFLSRCLFLYFIQRKRWLGNDTDFLRTFWETYQNTSQDEDSFVAKWLNVLFFEAFNNRFHGGYTYFSPKLREILQLAPYLNGGLFRENELDTAYIVNVSDDLWEDIFVFFEQYNFTIAEDTPLDQEVAVDPEMIGKVYESLVSVEDEERGDAGIFYTPRVEIDLMCRLALVDNLANHIGTQDDKYLFYEVLFAFEPTEKAEADAKLSDLWEPIHKYLTEITVLDPACGSGSFLVGMLHVLDDLRERAQRSLSIKGLSRFEHRKALIVKNLYGVDVKPWACKVAELRLWLALIIDAEFTIAELNVRTDPLLPDFSFNIRHGDSIVQDIGGMNLAQTRALGSRVTPNLQRKIRNFQDEKFKFSNGVENRKYAEKEDVETAKHSIFRELLENHEFQLDRDIRATEAWLEDPAEQLTIDGLTPPEPHQLNIETAQKQRELVRHKENRAQMRRTRAALSSNTTTPFVWDIDFFEIFNQRDGFDIVVENPPYIRQERIADPTLPREEVTTINKKEYKAKLARSVYQAFPDYFGYNKNRNTVQHKLDAKSDLYVYFYFHGLFLLNPKGTFCTITSNSWLDVAYGTKLQEFILTQCSLKLVLDNSSKRSFASADVNTIICLISAPKENSELIFHNISRFVNFKVPFEMILDAIIFYEVETANNRIETPEHNTHPSTQKILFTNGINEKEKYIGDKWGGKFLRAPNIYWTILEKSQDKLKRVGDVAKIRFGLKTGADKFFILDRERILELNLESEFLKSVFASPKDTKNLLAHPEQFPKKLFLCDKKKKDLIGTSALDYIEWGESQGFHLRPSIKHRRRWYDLGSPQFPHLSLPGIIGSTAKTVYVPEGCYALANFSEIYTPPNLRLPLCLSLNSTFFQLMVNVNGRANFGGGVMTLKVYELENSLCVDPQLLNVEDTIADLNILESEEWDVLKPSEARRQIDKTIFEILKLTQGECDGVYEAVTQLVTTRLQKAKT